MVERILVTGSRDWEDELMIRYALKQYLPPADQWFVPTVMHGACRGADKIAAAQALDLGFVVQDFPADWKTHGMKAGVLRNLQMLDCGPDVVLAFRRNGSRGTTHCIEAAKARGIPVVVHEHSS